VVDETDRMLDMGFIPDVEKICSLMPRARQTLFFSATMPPEVKRLTDQFLVDPKLIEVAPPASAAATVTQRVQPVSPRGKLPALKKWLQQDDVTSAIIFCNRKRDVSSIHTSLKRADFSVGQLHGDMAQPDRMETLKRLKDGEIAFLVASDVAARGLDIASVSHVFNYDVPNNPDDYVHRIGRTGRAGRAGTAVTLATDEDAKALAEIEKNIGTAIERLEPTQDKRSERSAPPAEDTPPPREDEAENKSKSGRSRGRRRRKEEGDKRGEEPVVGFGDAVPAFFLRSAKDESK